MAVAPHKVVAPVVVALHTLVDLAAVAPHKAVVLVAAAPHTAAVLAVVVPHKAVDRQQEVVEQRSDPPFLPLSKNIGVVNQITFLTWRRKKIIHEHAATTLT